MAIGTEILRQEHKSIRNMLDLTEKLAAKMNHDEPVAPKTLAMIMEFIQLYVEQCHHHKEEDILFPLLEQKGIPSTGGPLGIMLMEHERGRQLISELTAATEAYKGDGGSGKNWIKAAWGYSDLMHDHFGKEEEILFRMADNALSADDQARVASEFAILEETRIGSTKHQKLEETMKELVAQNGTA